jgi:ABC-type transport system substrate-binding protein
MGVSYGQQQPQVKPLRMGLTHIGYLGDVPSDYEPLSLPQLTDFSLKEIIGSIQGELESIEGLHYQYFQPVYPAFSFLQERDGGKVFYAELKPNIYFHDGSLATIDDLEFSLYRNLYRDPFAIKRIKFKRLSAVAFTLSSDRLENWYRLLDTELRKRVGAGKMSISAGPYIITAVDRAKQKVSLRKFDKYFAGPPLVPEIEYTLYKNSQMAMFGFLANEVDYLCGLNKGQIEAIGNIPNLRVERYTDLYIFALWFNILKPPMDDIRVRKAISLLIDRKSFLTKSDYLRNSIIPTSYQFAMSSPVTKIHADPPNPAEASKLLQEAGYVRKAQGWEKGGKPLHIAMHMHNRQRGYIPEVRMLKKFLEEAGLKVTFEVAPFNYSNTGATSIPDKYDISFMLDYDKSLFELNAAKYIPGDPNNYYGTMDAAPGNMLAGAKSGSITPGEKEAIIRKVAEYYYEAPLFYLTDYCVGRVGTGYEDLFFSSPFMYSSIIHNTPSGLSPTGRGRVANGR